MFNYNINNMIDLEKRRELGKVPKLITEELLWYINHHYNDAEILAITSELRTSLQKRINAYNDECFKLVNEGTEEEDEEFDEGEYDSMIAKLQTGAREILVKEQERGISEDGWNPDLLNELRIEY